jgi:hypothetical protein
MAEQNQRPGFQEYPKMLHHSKHGQKTVKNRDEQDALGSEWYENYADAEREKEAAKAEQQRADAGTLRAKSDDLANELEADADEKANPGDDAGTNKKRSKK